MRYNNLTYKYTIIDHQLELVVVTTATDVSYVQLVVKISRLAAVSYV